MDGFWWSKLFYIWIIGVKLTQFGQVGCGGSLYLKNTIAVLLIRQLKQMEILSQIGDCVEIVKSKDMYILLAT